MKQLTTVLQRRRRVLLALGYLLVLVCAAASTVFSIFGPKILGQATTKLFEGVVAMLTGTARGGRPPHPEPLAL